jgi:hypothetical protein
VAQVLLPICRTLFSLDPLLLSLAIDVVGGRRHVRIIVIGLVAFPWCRVTTAVSSFTTLPTNQERFKTLRIRDVYPGPRILILSIPDPGSNNGIKRGGKFFCVQPFFVAAAHKYHKL